MQEISYFLWFLLRKGMQLYNMAHEKEKHDERWMGLYNAREKGMHWERNMLFFLSLLKSPSSEHKNKNENDGSMWEWNEWKKPILKSVFPCNGWPMQSNVLDILFTFFLIIIPEPLFCTPSIDSRTVPENLWFISSL